MLFKIFLFIIALWGEVLHAQLPPANDRNSTSLSTKGVSHTSDLELKLMTLNQAILDNPLSPELQLRKGVYLMELGRVQQAIDIFEALRNEYPNHPAPYINLASVFAQQGRLEDARQMLLKSDSLYSERYQTQLDLASVNMGLALAALNKANELSSGDPGTQRKIREIEQLVSKLNNSTFSSAGQVMPVPVRVEKSFRSEPFLSKPKAIGSTYSGTEAEPKRSDRLKLSAFPLRDTPLNADANSADLDRRNRIANAASDEVRVEVMNTVESWASAWSKRDLVEYTSYYSRQFKAQNGMNRDAWSQYKKNVIEKASFINVNIKIKHIKISKNRALVKINQKYQSNLHSDFSQKELKLIRENDQWRIVSENHYK